MDTARHLSRLVSRYRFYLSRLVSRYRFHLAVCALALSFCLIAGTAFAAVVTVDPATKTATSDVDTLQGKAVRVAGDQIGVYIQSLVETPQTFKLKIPTAKDEDYDIYINEVLTGTKPGKVLREGLEINIPGTVADPDKMRCLRALEPVVRPEYERMRESKDPEVMRVAFMYNQVVDFVASGLRNERVHRSAAVIVAPSDKVLEKMIFITYPDAKTSAMATTRACWLIQKARARIFEVIKNPILRNSSIVTITPVVLDATYSIRNGKPHVDAVVTNNCDITVSGTISMDLPQGWKHNAKSLTFSDLKSGKTVKIGFDLIAPSKSAPAPPTVPLGATVKVYQNTLNAEAKFTKTAALTR